MEIEGSLNLDYGELPATCVKLIKPQILAGGSRE